MQTAGQYTPFNHKINNLDLIVYPVLDENPLDEIFKNEDDIKTHLDTLFKIHKITEGRYHIIFVWNLNNRRMTDIWIHKLENWSAGCGPLLEVITFRDLQKTNDAGIASGDSIMTLGREEELRRNTATLEEYLDRDRLLPSFMPGFKPNKKF